MVELKVKRFIKRADRYSAGNRLHFIKEFYKCNATYSVQKKWFWLLEHRDETDKKYHEAVMQIVGTGNDTNP